MLNPEKIIRVGLVANSTKPAACAALHQALALIERNGRMAAAEESTAFGADLKCPTYPSAKALARASDLLLVFGGDGTILRAVRECDGSHPPILGINIGRLGFLTAASLNDLAPALDRIWAGDFTVQPHPLLGATGQGRGQPINVTALNDVVISHGKASRLVELEVKVDGEELTVYGGDGLIISSPAGSTGHSLSAGGPIINPTLPVIAITPICPHALTSRPVIINLSSTIEVKVLSQNLDIILAADGEMDGTLDFGDLITVRRTRRDARLVHLGGWSFFDTVRRKLHWSGTAV